MISLKIEETLSPFGAIVSGFDFGAQDKEAIDSVKRALTQHNLLVSRGHPEPTDESISSFFRNFGDLSSETPEVKAHFARLAKLVPEYLEGGASEIGARFNLSNVEEDGKKMGGLGNRELEWHNDQADLPRLKIISCLEALEFEKGAGNTFFCDMYAAAETLPSALRKELAGVSAIHESTRYRSDVGENIQNAPSAMHPVLLAHPETGRTCVYVNRSFTSRIVGLSEKESDELLAEIFEHSYREEFMFEHHWQTGDVVIWDNVGLQHMRNPLDSSRRRTLRVFQGVSEAWKLSSASRAINTAS